MFSKRLIVFLFNHIPPAQMKDIARKKLFIIHAPAVRAFGAQEPLTRNPSTSDAQICDLGIVGLGFIGFKVKGVGMLPLPYNKYVDFQKLAGGGKGHLMNWSVFGPLSPFYPRSRVQS